MILMAAPRFFFATSAKRAESQTRGGGTSRSICGVGAMGIGAIKPAVSPESPGNTPLHLSKSGRAEFQESQVQ
jgi:hypothetical protein